MSAAGRLGFAFVVSFAWFAFRIASAGDVVTRSSGSCLADTCDVSLQPEQSLLVIDRQRKIKQVSSIKYVDVHEGGPVSIELSTAGSGAQHQQDPADVT